MHGAIYVKFIYITFFPTPCHGPINHPQAHNPIKPHAEEMKDHVNKYRQLCNMPLRHKGDVDLLVVPTQNFGARSSVRSAICTIALPWGNRAATRFAIGCVGFGVSLDGYKQIWPHGG